jgi:O-antigen ligase
MKENNKVNQLERSLIRTFFTVLLLVVVGTMNLEFVLPPQDFPDILPTSVYLILAAISLFIFLVLWIDYRLRHRFKLIEILFILLMIYPILANVLNQGPILLSQLNPSLQDTTTLFTIPTMQNLQGIFFGMSVGIILYSIFFLINPAYSAKNLTRWVLGILIGVVVIEVIYSLFMEWEEYVYVFENFNDGLGINITSFTNNPNTYSFMLTMGIYALGFLFMAEKKYRLIYVPLGIIFSVMIVFTVSKTGMFAIVIYVAVYILLLSYRSLTTKKTLQKIILTGLIFLIFVGYQSIFFIDHPFMDTLQSLLTVSALNSFDSRVDIWVEGIRLIQSDNTWLGYGLGLSNTYLGVATAIGSIDGTYQIVNDRFHNGFIEILVSYGLIGTLLLIVAHWHYFKALVQLTKLHEITIPMWALIFSFAIQMMFEDRILFRPDVSGIIFLVILILPIAKSKDYNQVNEVND